MALRDYSVLDETDFYGQPFDRYGVASVWVGLKDDSEGPDGLDVLQDLCGVGYYDPDKQESNSFEFDLVPVEKLLMDLSFSNTFLTNATGVAHAKGLAHARWILVQYDFAYDPKMVQRQIAEDPVFIGSFEYQEE